MKKVLFFIIFYCFKIFSFEVVVVGGGVSGLNASLALLKEGVEVLTIEGRKPSYITKSSLVKNLENPVSGKNLIDSLKEEILKKGGKIIKKDLFFVDFSKKPFVLKVDNFFKKSIKAKFVIIATGSRLKDCYNVKRFLGRGVYNCPKCDGFLFKGKEVAIIGNRDKVLKEAEELLKFAKKVYVVTDGNFKEKEGIVFIDKRNVKNIKKKGDKFKIGKNILDGIFFSFENLPNSEIFKGQIELDKKGFIVLKKGRETSKKGVFAAGNIVKVGNAIKAQKEGIQAAKEILKFYKIKK